jgi:hypothetical protein
MSKLGGKVMSENTDSEEIAAGTVTSVNAGTNVTVTGTASDPIINADTQNNAKVTTKGDIEGFSTVAARIPVGTNDDVLTADSTAALGVSWKTPAAGGGGVVGGRALRTTSASSGGTNYTLVYQTEDYDDSTFIDLGTDNDRFTVPTGVTRINLQCYLDMSNITVGAGVSVAFALYNSSDVFQRNLSMSRAHNTTAFMDVTISALGITVTPGEYIEVQLFSSDSSYTINAASATIQDVSP